MRLVIASNDDLEQARRLASWLNRPTVDHVLVSVPWLDTDERGRIAKGLETHFNDCGCTWGAAAFLLALAWCFLTHPWGSASVWASAGYAMAASVTAAVAGKAVGLTWSRVRLRILLQRVSR